MFVVLYGLSLRSFWGFRGTHVLQVDGARTIGSGVSNITVGALAVGRAWCGKVGLDEEHGWDPGNWSHLRGQQRKRSQ